MNGRRRRMWLTPRAGLMKVTAVIATAVLLIGAAVIVNGFDVKQTPVNDSSVWALQNGGGNRYARVNTDLAEFDTVKTVRSPSSLVQTDSQVLLFAQNNEKVVDVSLAQPADLRDDAPDYQNTPPGTVSVVSTGSWIGYRTATGQVYAARSGAAAGAAPVLVDPDAANAPAAGETRATYAADSIAIGTDGILYSYSIGDAAVARTDLNTGKFAGKDDVPGAPSDEKTQLTVVGTTWVLMSAAADTLWIRGRDAAVGSTGLSKLAALQRPSSGGDVAYVADDSGLSAVRLSDGALTRVTGATGTSVGIPAAPTEFDGAVYGAWLPSVGTQGVLWSSADGEHPLPYGTRTSNGDPAPVFQAGGSRMILNDTQSGWVWTVPDGRLVSGSQDWALAAQNEPQQNANVEKASVVVDPKAPVAEPDALGVRAGQLVQLPVLLNDHDANDDVLTIVPASVTGLDPAWGTLTVTDQSQSIAVQVAPGAQGTMTFSYAITDGTRSDGLVSPPTTVTLTVHDLATNAAPVWCGIVGCLRDWPTPEVQPGGLVSVETLPGWVDPDGDPIFVSEAENTSGVGTVSATTDGTVVYKHPNAAEQNLQPVSIGVRVSDVYGATATKALAIQVTATPKLIVQPFAQLASVGEHLTVDPSAHLGGAAGAWRITSATTPPATEGATETIGNGGATFDFVATQPGSYLVSMTITDALSTVISLVRITAVAPQSAPLSTAPVSVFVRPKVDTSVDVFTAVSNPTGLVLLLSDAVPEKTPGATLDVDVVGQTILRVRGTSADEQPGKLGTVRYTVSDGTGNASASVQGAATVYLLPASVPLPPIAVADHAVVRSGAQIDIPVLDNDVAPDGNVVVLSADSIQNPSGLGLAFAAGPVLRYLAPAEAGTYEVRYTVSIAGSAELTDTATVTIDVLAPGQNQPPQPKLLTGRVLSGESVEIPFDGFEIDPDGDSVVLDRVMTQPLKGTAALTAAGDAIVYTSVAGPAGPVDFTYRVRDAGGLTATATVRIGVLDRPTNPRPITFSDYVEVKTGGTNQVVVSPARNDIEPSGAVLKLTGVVPDATAGSAEYDSLVQRIGKITDNTVVLTAGDQPGTMTFTYSVMNPNGDIGLGLIVMKVVRSSVSDYPLVRDTLVSAEQRASLSAGLDVVSGKVSWASGDVGGLTLKLWGDTHGMSVSGWKITGDAPDAGFLLPFSLTGPDFEGTVVTTYGFLRLPAKDAVILALNRGDATQKVKEDSAVSFDLAKLVTIPAGATLEIDTGRVAASGQRVAATCRIDNGSTVTYTAGTGAPWADTCTVPARFGGQTEYTQLVVPIIIEALDPQPVLRSASLTQSPGSAALTFDLTQMATWQGHTDLSPLTFELGPAGDLFVVKQTGSVLSITTADSALSGSEVAVKVSLSSHPLVVAAALSLKVGPVPSTLPKGGTVASQCSVSKGANCAITVIGAAGEVNLFSGTALTLVSVAKAATCVGVTFAVQDASTVTASWTPDTAGGSCQASFVVRDAQGRDSAGERNGSITVDLHGYPKAPNSVTQVAYSDKSITFSVTPGSASAAYPALTGFTITQNGNQVATCDASGSCGSVTTAQNGEQLIYEARAVNSEGSSTTGVSSKPAWSYAAPGIGSVSAETVYNPAWTTATTGAVTVHIVNTDASTHQYEIGGQHYDKSAGTETVLSLQLPVGPQTVTVTPLSAFAPPLTGGSATSAATPAPVTVAGLPSLSRPAVGSFGATASAISVGAVEVNSNFSAAPIVVQYYAYGVAESAKSCVPTAEGNSLVATNTSPELAGLVANREYTVKICASNGFGVTETTVGPTLTWDAPHAPDAGSYSYNISGSKGVYTLDSDVSSSVAPPSGFFADFDRSGTGVSGAPHITARYCLNGHDVSENRCGDKSADIAAADPTRAWQVNVTSVEPQCTVGSALALTVNDGGIGGASAEATSAEFFVEPLPSSTPDPTAPPAAGEWKTVQATASIVQVPAGASKVRTVNWKLAWSKTQTATSGFDTYTGTTPTDSPCR